MFKTAALALLTFAAVALAPAPAIAQKSQPQAVAKAGAATKTGHMAIDGVDYYYEIHGKGEPLLLLHGGLGSIDMFGPALAKLAETREVIAVDLQGHGRTALGERPFKLESMGDDMAALVAKLGRKQVDVLGYSMGGGVAFRMAAQHPQSVRRLAMVSTPFSDDGFYPGIRAQQNQVGAAMAPMMEQTPMYQTYAAVAPNKGEFPRLLDTVGNYMKQHYDWSADVAKLTMPTMLVYGDGDMFRPEHEIKFYQLLGGGLQDAGWQRETLSKNRLAILPDVTHYDIFAAPRLIPTVLPFLDGKSDAKSWAEQTEKR
ncbi:alpha/beta hydrolase [Luteimonas gilva]|uniref:Alpha/beta hydrolase n=1 Tax=Luteimonas gilva TaxID=2572684 RepID=A0A4U5JJJ6_9GAMM|nr:alpha/beta hydrolase [Luteimonas gilva]TKR29544.1 alpha/beta hydrolase [Luteimonas gilva]